MQAHPRPPPSTSPPCGRGARAVPRARRCLAAAAAVSDCGAGVVRVARVPMRCGVTRARRAAHAPHAPPHTHAAAHARPRAAPRAPPRAAPHAPRHTHRATRTHQPPHAVPHARPPRTRR
eukprot:279484-Prymnesium_polylepis.1